MLRSRSRHGRRGGHRRSRSGLRASSSGRGRERGASTRPRPRRCCPGTTSCRTRPRWKRAAITIDAAPADVWPLASSRWDTGRPAATATTGSIRRASAPTRSCRNGRRWLSVATCRRTRPAASKSACLEPQQALVLYVDDKMTADWAMKSEAELPMRARRTPTTRLARRSRPTPRRRRPSDAGGRAHSGAMLGSKMPKEFAGTWTFVLERTPEGDTRLIERVRFHVPARRGTTRAEVRHERARVRCLPDGAQADAGHPRRGRERDCAATKLPTRSGCSVAGAGARVTAARRTRVGFGPHDDRSVAVTDDRRAVADAGARPRVPLAERALARRVREVPPSGIRRFFDIAATMDDVISLGIGEPDFDTPKQIVEAGVQSLREGRTHYTSQLRHARAAPGARPPTSSARYGVRYDPATRDPRHGRRVGGGRPRAARDLRPRRRGDPPRALVRRLFAGHHVLRRVGVPFVSTRLENDFALDPADIEAAITPRTKALFLGYPCNPTGAVLPPDVLDEIARIAVRHDLLVYSDEIYDRLAYGDYRHRAVSALPGMRERTILMGGFSKAYAMTGWRVGFLCAPAGDARGHRQGPPVRDHVGRDDGPGRGARGAAERRARRRADARRVRPPPADPRRRAEPISACGPSSRAARSTRFPQITSTGLSSEDVRRRAPARGARRVRPGRRVRAVRRGPRPHVLRDERGEDPRGRCVRVRARSSALTAKRARRAASLRRCVRTSIARSCWRTRLGRYGTLSGR